jgi:LysR family transcriptional regulator (chromosome initiation inhibitor)
MGCVSTESTAPTGFVAESIGAMEYECVAHPAFAEMHFAQELTLHSILAVPAVLFNRTDGLHALFLGRLLGFPVRGYVAHYFPSPSALLAAIQFGVGYGLVPSLQAQPLLNSGDLVSLAPHHKIPVDLYWHRWETAPPNARTISDMVMHHARQTLIQLRRDGEIEASDVPN